MASILAVDDDPWIVKMVADLLSRRGHDVRTAADGEEALRMAEASAPDLVITDIWMPKMDGFTFVKTMRTKANLTLVPVLFLTSDATGSSRMRGFELGADEYLTKPFRFDDLWAHIERVLSKPRPEFSPPPEPEAAPPQTSALQGDLLQLGLAGVLTLLEMERKSGILRLDAKEGKGEMHVRDGRLVFASTESGERNAKAIYAALAWEGGGRFKFEPGEITRDDEIQTPTMYLLMEGMRLLDESRRTDVD